jgi:RES domain-containing protein
LISVFRISSAVFPVNSGAGAALYGGRWNNPGTEVIYVAQSASLAALEVLVHYSVLPRNQLLTQIVVPDARRISRIEVTALPEDWRSDPPAASTRAIGDTWASRLQTAVLSVPSSTVPGERIFLLNPLHPDFTQIRFLPSAPFHFDARLK